MGFIKENENPFAESGEHDVFWDEDDADVDEETGEILASRKTGSFGEEDRTETSEDDDEGIYECDEGETASFGHVKIFGKGTRIDYLAEGLTEPPIPPVRVRNRRVLIDYFWEAIKEPPLWSWSDEDGNWETGTVFSGAIVEAKIVLPRETKFESADVKRSGKGVIYTVAQKNPVISPEGRKSSKWLITNAWPAHIAYALFKLLPQIGEMIHIEYEGLGRSSQGKNPRRLFTVKVGERGVKPRVWSSTNDTNSGKQEGSALKKRRKAL